MPALLGARVSRRQRRDPAEVVVFDAIADETVGGVIGIGLFGHFGFGAAATACSWPVGHFGGAVGVFVESVTSRRAASQAWGFPCLGEPSGLVVGVAVGPQGAFFI